MVLKLFPIVSVATAEMKLSRALARVALLSASALSGVSGTPTPSLFPIITGVVDIVGLDQLVYCTSGYLKINCLRIYLLLLKDGPKADISKNALRVAPFIQKRVTSHYHHLLPPTSIHFLVFLIFFVLSCTSRYKKSRSEV